jgi:hypothetical protein
MVSSAGLQAEPHKGHILAVRLRLSCCLTAVLWHEALAGNVVTWLHLLHGCSWQVVHEVTQELQCML